MQITLKINEITVVEMKSNLFMFFYTGYTKGREKVGEWRGERVEFEIERDGKRGKEGEDE